MSDIVKLKNFKILGESTLAILISHSSRRWWLPRNIIIGKFSPRKLHITRNAAEQRELA